MADQAPLYNLKAVVQQTGLKPDTLRAWERRYGLPAPARSAGGQRLYTQRDVEIVDWLEARRREGLSIARAVELFRQIEAQGRDPLQSPAPTFAPSSLRGEIHPIGSSLEQLRAEWLNAGLAYDEPRAVQAESQAFALYPPDIVCLDLLQWAVREVGELWLRGLATVHQEHHVTEQAIRRLEALLVAAPPATRRGRVLAACPAGEHHTFGLLTLTLLLRRRGWSVVFLGADVPVEKLEDALAAIRPDLVILSAQRLTSAAALAEESRRLQSSAVVGFAGGVFNRHPVIRARIAGHFLGESLDDALGAADSLLTTPRPVPPAEPIPAQARLALEHLRGHRASVEASVVRSAPAPGLSPAQVTDPLGELSDLLEAALSLGDVALLERECFAQQNGPCFDRKVEDMLPSLLGSYLRAAEAELDERGAQVLDWLRARAAG